MTICTYNACTLASETSVEDLMMQSRKSKYDVIGLTETRRHHPLHAAYDSGEELFLGTCDSRESQTPDSYESLTSRIGRLRLKRCGSESALTVFVAYAPTSDYDDKEVEAFYVELEKFYKEDHTFYKLSSATSTPRSGHEGRRKNFTSEPTVWSGTSKVKGYLSLTTKVAGRTSHRNPRFGVERAR
ncbi:unnamed protein product [Heligmosomoides polygyrus]|uniref:Endo/exonuclease/phosphatase domain-containing protein n=1 Tax=Heligmosomoides polygyrus TaxID=6339 RepID=A0A183FHJ2_HELPZ|nr:unnamed protein product [Heligmosomoides polygyrus]